MNNGNSNGNFPYQPTAHKLIIAEKPSVAKEIAKVVGAHSRKEGYQEGGGWLVSWCVGHLVSLAMPEAHDPKYKRRSVEDLPIFPDNWVYEVIGDTAPQFAILKSLMERPDVESLVCATDAGREGEHIFRLVYHQAECHKPFERLWVSSMEESAISEGIRSLRPGSEYDCLAAAADCRDKADWLVGMNASRLFRTGVGRVQSPTLALVVRREDDIARFKPSFTYAVRIGQDGFSAVSDRMADEAAAQKLCETVAGQSATVLEVTEKEAKASPPRLYDLTTLQREANRMFGLSAKETLQLAQALYEKKLLTYPRTDSSYLTEDMLGSTGELLTALAGQERFPFAQKNDQPDIGRVVNSAKVSDHHALLPTPNAAGTDLSKLSPDEMTVLSLVTCRLFAAVSTPEVSVKMTAVVECAGTVFRAKGKTVLNPGWKVVQESFRATFGKKLKEDKEDVEEPEAALPPLAQGQTFPAVTAQVDTIKASPPAHFTEDTLLASMERAGNSEYDDPDVEKKGLGTPATMADTIEGLVKRGLLERKKKQILPSQAGRNLVKLLPLSLTSPKLTVEWESSLQRMARGDGNADSFLQDIHAYLCVLVAEFDAMTPEQKALIPAPKGRESLGSCPRCGSPVYEGQKNFYCSGDGECRFGIWKDNKFFQNAKKKLTKAIVQSFLTTGQCAIKGLYSIKKDRTYDAVVVMEDTGKWVNFKPVFDSKPKSGGKK